jgi:drug/metabolite transporter (DMT)-like permease
MSLRVKIYFGFIIICLLWGSSWAAVKIGLEGIPPLLSLTLRFSIASIILGVVVLVRRLRVPTDQTFWRLAALLCVTSFTIPFAFIYWGQIRVDSGLASVLFATYPLWVAILSHFFLPNEKITLLKIAGMILGFLGVLYIFYDGLFNVNNTILGGMFAIVISAIIQAFGLVAIRRWGTTVHPVTLNLWPMVISILPLFILSFMTEDYSTIVFNTASLGSLLYLALFCTVVTFVVYFWLVKYVEVVILSLSAFMTPVLAIIIGGFVVGEKITGRIIAGSLIVLLGVAVATIGDLVTVYRRKMNES